MAAGAMASSGAGAGERWGVLSGVADGWRTYNLEWALPEVGRGDARCEAVTARLPLARAMTELGREPHRLAELVGDVAALAAEYPLLRDFLPASDRPPVSTVRDLDRRTPLIKLSVTETEGDWGERSPHIALHDVVSAHRGRGVGTEAIAELCRYADRRSLPIVGRFVPDSNAGPEGTLRLARWYCRFGFEQADRPAELWKPLAEMRREPRTNERLEE